MNDREFEKIWLEILEDEDECLYCGIVGCECEWDEEEAADGDTQQSKGGNGQ